MTTPAPGPGAAERRAALRDLVAPALASLVCLGILVGLGVWQLERKAWKEALIDRIVARSRIDPPAPLPAFDAFDPARDEFERVRTAGRFLHDKETLVHGLAPGDTPGRALQGYYVITPLRLDDGRTVLINRGFVPTELKEVARRAAGQVGGEATVTGMLRQSEARAMFVPAPNPQTGEWFNRDVPGIAAAKGLATTGPSGVAPYLIEADQTPNPGGWPKGGQLRVDLPNNHLQYAFTWFGLALCLVGVFTAFALRRLRGEASEETGENPASAAATPPRP
ncbi:MULTISPECIES: SURF1 family protein [Methylobacterium]|uniref:SURF1 family protein n=1 Tax=Methylobacterium TaxID=407 RepID=UPI0008F22E46|nr:MULTISPECIES: SURF1 family protein [Methylobacterium]MBZ6413615.1 SURF1 family protein [Methylobacterium sp.]MBK3397296.1 SURF1 family protein [Methylobacterium ajmalii]MBK3412655.1 SURF1 family protein [Methylobacterium ajmalii]MBK3423789.1 SURF1 family protein [Methylobacterium ajmalii]SFF36589.1 surfeit locus 1 family protein [Methylobacterium sp. yr596]